MSTAKSVDSQTIVKNEDEEERERQMKEAFEKAKLREAARLEEVRKCFANASLEVKRVSDQLSHQHRMEAIRQVAELYDISSYELLYYEEFGEEEAERHFNMLKAKEF